MASRTHFSYLLLYNQDKDRTIIKWMPEDNMNSRERVLCTVNHVQPDRTPTDLQAVGEIWDGLKRYFQTKKDEDILEALEIDCRWVGPHYKGPAPENRPDGTYVGWGGSVLRKVYNKYGAYEEVVKYAADEAETPEDAERLLKLPYLKDYDFSAVAEACKKHSHKFILAGFASTFYFPTLVRSMENILVDMAINPELAHHLFKKCVDWHMGYHERLLEAGKGRIDAMQIADDFSTQLGPLMSVDMFREYFKEPIRKFADMAKSYGAIPYLHCCGSAYKLIHEFIDAGIEILDPIQTRAANMEPVRLKQEFGSRLTFHGAAETQSILPSGTPEEVRQNARELVDILGRNGGYILSSCHALQADVPIENVLALYDVANR
jgi:uroporphyrinogen decarboxylase